MDFATHEEAKEAMRKDRGTMRKFSLDVTSHIFMPSFTGSCINGLFCLIFQSTVTLSCSSNLHLVVVVVAMETVAWMEDMVGDMEIK